jgi:hypothetical protein
MRDNASGTHNLYEIHKIEGAACSVLAAAEAFCTPLVRDMIGSYALLQVLHDAGHYLSSQFSMRNYYW